MSESDKVFAGSIPKLYDTLMVPLIFEAYAADLAELVAASSPGAVLETAAGSGVVARALAPRLKPDARYVVTDLNQPMLDYAATRQGPDSRIEWRQADALDLPFEDASFDVVCCQFGAMFFSNRVAGYAEARRVLQARRALCLQCLGPHRRERLCRRRHQRRRRGVSARPSAIPRPHAARLSRHRTDPRGIEPRRVHRHRDRDARGGESRALGTRRRHRLLPGNAAAQRNRGARRQLASARNGPRGARRSPAVTAKARWPARFRRTWSWRRNGEARSRVVAGLSGFDELGAGSPVEACPTAMGQSHPGATH